MIYWLEWQQTEWTLLRNVIINDGNNNFRWQLAFLLSSIKYKLLHAIFAIVITYKKITYKKKRYHFYSLDLLVSGELSLCNKAHSRYHWRKHSKTIAGCKLFFFICTWFITLCFEMFKKKDGLTVSLKKLCVRAICVFHYSGNRRLIARCLTWKKSLIN